MKLRPTRKGIPLIVVLVIFIGIFAISTALLSSTMIPSSGKIVYSYGLGIYWDNNCNEKVSFLDWGTAEPGLTQNVIIYIQNEGNTPTILNLSTTSWIPEEAPNYMTLSWDYNDEAIEPSEVVQVTLTLSISPTIEEITNFAFDIVISES